MNIPAQVMHEKSIWNAPSLMRIMLYYLVRHWILFASENYECMEHIDPYFYIIHLEIIWTL